MNVLIVYYSQTGNTQKVARAIRDGVLAAGHSVRVIPLKAASAAMLESYDLIGLGSPVWCADPPPFRRFLESLPPQNGKHAFLFCTHGTMPGLFAPVVARLMQELGFTLTGIGDWYGDCQIQVFPSPYYTAGHPDAQDLEEARAFGEAACRRSEDIRGGLTEPLSAPFPDVSPLQACAVASMLTGTVSPHCGLRRDASKCLHASGCRICQDNCPMGYIDLDAGRFGCHGDACGDGHGCTYCEMLCPTGAIYADPPFETKAPLGVPHGFSLFESILDKAEAEGKFRRLLPREQVGETTPYWSVTGHPRRKPLSANEDELP